MAGDSDLGIVGAGCLDEEVALGRISVAGSLRCLRGTAGLAGTKPVPLLYWPCQNTVSSGEQFPMTPATRPSVIPAQIYLFLFSLSFSFFKSFFL